MASLVHQLQADLTGSQKKMSEIMRTAKLIAAKLGLDDITAWLDLELRGYPDVDQVPSYRMFCGGQVQYFNPYQGWRSAGFVKVDLPIMEPIPAIEELIKDTDIFLPLTGKMRFDLKDPIGNSFEQRLVVNQLHFLSALEAVKEKLLDWTIELEKRGIVGEDMSFKKSEQESAKSQTFHIQNFTGVLGDVSGSQFQIYNYSSIHQQIKDAGVPKGERDALEVIMDDLSKAPPQEKPRLLDRAKAWVVKNESFLGATVGVVRRALGIEASEK
jgi:hypothetical protein